MYTVRYIKDHTFEIARFDDRKEPLAVYTVSHGKCSCPASYRSKKCKHLALVKAKMFDPDISFYEIEGDQVKVIPIDLFNSLS